VALSAKFVADFASFYDAVSRAEGSLRSFETGASKVESSLNRMVDAFSGRKVIQDATLMAEAVERIGGVSKLTQDELVRLQGTVGTAIEKMKAMGIEVPPGIQKIATELEGVDAAVDTTAKKFEGLATALTVANAAQEIRNFAGDVKAAADVFVGAYAEEEAAVKSLGVAMQAQGTATDATIEAYRALATQFQNTTAFSDDAIIAMEALFVQVGDVGPQQMEAALTAATNLSAGLGIELEAATMLVAKAFATGGENLGRLKTILGDTVPEGASMAEVMEAINDKFGGQAAAQLDTYNGRMANLGNQMGDVQEKVGQLIVQGLTPLLNLFGQLPQPVQTVAIAFTAIGVALAPLAVSFASLVSAIGPLVALLGPAGLGLTLSGVAIALGAVGAAIAAAIIIWKNWDAIVAGSKAIWEGLKTTFNTVATAITDTAQRIYDGVKTWLVDRLNGLVASIQSTVTSMIDPFKRMYDAVVGHSYVPDTIDGIESQFGRLDSVMVGPAQAATSATSQAFAGMASNVVASVEQATQALTSLTRTESTIGTGQMQGGAASGGGGGGGKGLQIPVPANFNWSQAYRDAGYFVHDSPFLGLSQATDKRNFGAASLGFLPREYAVTANTYIYGMTDTSDGFRALTTAVKNNVMDGVKKGRKISA
jgi:hypothetical protein